MSRYIWYDDETIQDSITKQKYRRMDWLELINSLHERAMTKENNIRNRLFQMKMEIDDCITVVNRKWANVIIVEQNIKRSISTTNTALISADAMQSGSKTVKVGWDGFIRTKNESMILCWGLVVWVSIAVLISRLKPFLLKMS